MEQELDVSERTNSPMQEIDKNSAKRRYKKSPTKKELRRIAKMVVTEEKSVEESMVKVGYAPSTARAHPDIITKNPEYKEVESELRLALRNHVPEIFKKVALQTNAGLEANRTISAISSKEANGASTDFIEVPDHAVRLKYCEFVAKVFGQFNEVSDGGMVFNVSKFYQFVVKAEQERGLA